MSSELPGPPRLAAALVLLFTPSFDSFEVLGDLEEGYRLRLRRGSPLTAKRWYWRESVRLIVTLLLQEMAMLGLGFWSDLRMGVRSLRREPTLVATAALTLGIGIGAPTTLFAVAEGFLKPLPGTDSQQILHIELFDRKSGRPLAPDRSLLEAWQTSGSELESLGAYWPDHVALSADGSRPQRYSAVYLTPNVFSILNVEVLRGRLIEESDLLPVSQPGVLISEDLWESRYQRASEAVGSDVRIDGTSYTIAGIVPRPFAFPADQDLWIPLQKDTSRSVRLVGLLRSGGSEEVLREQMLSTARGILTSDLPDVVPALEVEDYVTAHFGSESVSSLRVLTAVNSLLVLIAAANVAGLLLARGGNRGSEVALKLALGSSRSRIVRQFLGETLLLAFAGGAVALLLAKLGLGWFRTIAETQEVAYWMSFQIDGKVFGFFLLMVVLATLAAGTLPA